MDDQLKEIVLHAAEWSGEELLSVAQYNFEHWPRLNMDAERMLATKLDALRKQYTDRELTVVVRRIYESAERFTIGKGT